MPTQNKGNACRNIGLKSGNSDIRNVFNFSIESCMQWYRIIALNRVCNGIEALPCTLVPIFNSSESKVRPLSVMASFPSFPRERPSLGTVTSQEGFSDLDKENKECVFFLTMIEICDGHVLSTILVRGLPLDTYAPIGRSKVSHTFPLRITCKKKKGGGRCPDSMETCIRTKRNAPYGLCCKRADIPVYCVLSVTSQPGLDRGSSTKGQGRDHIKRRLQF